MITPRPVTGVPVGRQRGWITVTDLAVPTVWAATRDGLVLLDLIAVELAANGRRKGWTLTRDEAHYTATLLFDRDLPYSVIAHRIGVSGSTLKAWFPEQAVPKEDHVARAGGRNRNTPAEPTPPHAAAAQPVPIPALPGAA